MLFCDYKRSEFLCIESRIEKKLKNVAEIISIEFLKKSCHLSWDASMARITAEMNR
jgi:hypothetical protein